MSEKTLSALEHELSIATQVLFEATTRTESAQRQETDALNRLNEKQREFDAAVASIKKQAPRGTDWKRPAAFPEN